MKKILRILLIALILGAFIFTQNAHGEFTVDTGQKATYRLHEAFHNITISTTSELFEGFSDNGTVIIDNNSTIEIEVSEISTFNLDWKSVNSSLQMTGSCTNSVEAVDWSSFLIKAVYLLNFYVNFFEVLDTGIIEPVYYAPFELPLFVDTSNINWNRFDTLESFTEHDVYTMFSSFDVVNRNAKHYEFNNTMLFSLDYYCSYYDDDDNQAIWDSTASFSYNMLTGVLLEASTQFNFTSLWTGIPYAANSKYKIELIDFPDNPKSTNFLDFLSNNKWYFIGASGLVVLGVTLTTIRLIRSKKQLQ
ncbi:MAG: hypothetical protein FK733_00920 [Asgard group archaeon]|nr:hypothetical protein [Asgard group archaeon]